MARAALVALAWAAAAAAASAARYVDYSGVKMPQYGPGDYDSVRDSPSGVASADDYHGHSPDASASLDYKFDEDAHVELAGKSERPLKEADERESWSKYARRHRVLERMHDGGNLETNKYDPESENISHIKLNRRLPTDHLRQKIKKSRKESSQQRLVKYKRGRSERPDSDREYYHGSGDEARRGHANDIDDRVDGYRHTKVTERVVRRKQRDRHMRGRLEDYREINEDPLEPNRRMKLEHRTEPDYALREDDRERMNELEPYRPVVDEGDDAEVPSVRKHTKAYDNYGDYYDMKRVHNIKNKLPTLLRRTSARVASPTVTRTNVLDALWTHRRAAPPSAAPPAPRAPLVPSAPAPSARDLGALSVVPLPPTSTAAKSSAAVETTVSASRTTTSSLPNTPNTSKELSLAEKSRLSILKKAQRKESMRSDSSTGKPPVLMQVTDKQLTVVVVEPPSSEGPWLRAREVANDTPERVDRAKRLMRRKLIARAKNIQELTDNWDEMVCDYIDVSLLDSGLAPRRLSHLLLSLALLLLAT